MHSTLTAKDFFFANLYLPVHSPALFKTSLVFLSLAVATPQWVAADAEIKAPSGESTELKCSHFKAWNTSV